MEVCSNKQLEDKTNILIHNNKQQYIEIQLINKIHKLKYQDFINCHELISYKQLTKQYKLMEEQSFKSSQKNFGRQNKQYINHKNNKNFKKINTNNIIINNRIQSFFKNSNQDYDQDQDENIISKNIIHFQNKKNKQQEQFKKQKVKAINIMLYYVIYLQNGMFIFQKYSQLQKQPSNQNEPSSSTSNEQTINNRDQDYRIICTQKLSDFYIKNHMKFQIQQFSNVIYKIISTVGVSTGMVSKGIRNDIIKIQLNLQECAHILFYLIYGRFASYPYIRLLIGNNNMDHKGQQKDDSRNKKNHHQKLKPSSQFKQKQKSQSKAIQIKKQNGYSMFEAQTQRFGKQFNNNENVGLIVIPQTLQQEKMLKKNLRIKNIAQFNFPSNGLSPTDLVDKQINTLITPHDSLRQSAAKQFQNFKRQLKYTLINGGSCDLQNNNFLSYNNGKENNKNYNKSNLNNLANRLKNNQNQYQHRYNGHNENNLNQYSQRKLYMKNMNNTFSHGFGINKSNQNNSSDSFNPNSKYSNYKNQQFNQNFSHFDLYTRPETQSQLVDNTNFNHKNISNITTFIPQRILKNQYSSILENVKNNEKKNSLYIKQRQNKNLNKDQNMQQGQRALTMRNYTNYSPNNLFNFNSNNKKLSMRKQKFNQFFNLNHYFNIKKQQKLLKQKQNDQNISNLNNQFNQRSKNYKNGSKQNYHGNSKKLSKQSSSFNNLTHQPTYKNFKNISNSLKNQNAALDKIRVQCNLITGNSINNNPSQNNNSNNSNNKQNNNQTYRIIQAYRKQKQIKNLCINKYVNQKIKIEQYNKSKILQNKTCRNEQINKYQLSNDQQQKQQNSFISKNKQIQKNNNEISRQQNNHKIQNKFHFRQSNNNNNIINNSPHNNNLRRISNQKTNINLNLLNLTTSPINQKQVNRSNKSLNTHQNQGHQKNSSKQKQQQHFAQQLHQNHNNNSLLFKAQAAASMNLNSTKQNSKKELRDNKSSYYLKQQINPRIKLQRYKSDYRKFLKTQLLDRIKQTSS